MSAFGRAEDQYYDYDRYMRNLDDQHDEGCSCEDCEEEDDD